MPADAVYPTEDDAEKGKGGHSRPAIALRDGSVEGRNVRSTRTDGGDNAKYRSEDKRNEEEDRGEWNKEDSEEQEKEEEDRKDDEPTDEEAHTTKNLFQPASNILPNRVAQAVAEIFQGYDDLSGKETATLPCFLGDWPNWVGFDDSEEEDDAEWEQDKEREAEDVSKEDGHALGMLVNNTRRAKMGPELQRFRTESRTFFARRLTNFQPSLMTSPIKASINP